MSLLLYISEHPASGMQHGSGKVLLDSEGFADSNSCAAQALVCRTLMCMMDKGYIWIQAALGIPAMKGKDD